MGMDGVSSTDAQERAEETKRLQDEARQRAQDAANERTQQATQTNKPEPLQISQFQAPSFGQHPGPPSSTPNTPNANGSLADQAWAGMGAFNAQNTSSDKSQKVGRDNLEASSGMLDSQLDNEKNTFITFSGNDGKKYTAFRSENAMGAYYGFREQGTQEWKNITDAPVDDPSTITSYINDTHREKNAAIDRAGGFEDYKALKRTQGELKDITDIYTDSNGQPKVGLNDTQRQTLKRAQTLDNNISSLLRGTLPQGVTKGTISSEIASLREDQATMIELVKQRLEKAGSAIGDEKQKELEGDLNNALDESGVKKKDDGSYDLSKADKGKLSKSLDSIDQKITNMVDFVRNEKQKLSADQAKEKQDLEAKLTKVMGKLAKRPSQGFDKLQQRFDSIKNITDPNKGKYALEQLQAFDGYLGSKGLIAQANSIPDDKPQQTAQTRAASYSRSVPDSKVPVKWVRSDEDLKRGLHSMNPNGRVHVKNRNTGQTVGYYTKDANGDVFRDAGEGKLAVGVDPDGKVLNSKERYLLEKTNEGIKAIDLRSTSTGSRVNYHYDTEQKQLRIFLTEEDRRGDRNGEYQEIKPQYLEAAGIDVFTVNIDGEDRHLATLESAPDEPREVHLSQVEGAPSTLGYTTSSKDAKQGEVNGLTFFFKTYGEFVGIAADRSRSQGLSYTQAELEQAAAKAFKD